MSQAKGSRFGRHRQLETFAILAVLALFGSLLAGCRSKPNAESKRYHLQGKVMSVAPAEGSAVVDADAIPGWMDAMAMSYSIPDQKALAGLAPGDVISADIVVTGDGSYHLENVVVTKKGDGKSPTSDLHQPQKGDPVPDFTLTNQDGHQIRLDSYKGKVTLVTFIYTQCPFPDYCPLVSQNFADIYAKIHDNPVLDSKVRLLSVSFDPAHDTPEVLRKYAATFQHTTGGSPFGRWQFATASPDEMEKMTNFFGVLYDPSAKQVVHSLSTSVISPDGRIYKWYSGNEWKPADLVADATMVLAQENSAADPVSAHQHALEPSVAVRN